MQNFRIIKRISLIIFGLLLGMVLLEIGLRIGGFLFLSLQEYRNRISLRQKDTYRILCLGESTTAMGGKHAYPRQLEEVLNHKDLGIRFSVINGGLVATDTGVIVSQLLDNLDKYNPDMVVTMMGINDDVDTMQYEDIFIKKHGLLLGSLRVYKLLRLIQRLVIYKAIDIGIYDQKEDIINISYGGMASSMGDRESIPNKQKDIRAHKYRKYLGIGIYYRDQGEYDKAEGLFKRAIGINPEDDKAYLELGMSYSMQGRMVKAKEMFERAIEINPENDQAYIQLGANYLSRAMDNKARGLFRKAIEINPRNQWGYLELGLFYRNKGERDKVEVMFEKAIEIGPENSDIYFKIGRWYRDQAETEKAEEMFRRAIEIDPENDQAYCELGFIYSMRGMLINAEQMLKKTIKLNPKNDKAYVELGRCHRKIGEKNNARDMFKRAIMIKTDNVDAYFELGDLYREEGEYDKAEDMLKKIRPESDKLCRVLAELYEQQGRGKSADECFRRANRFRHGSRPTTRHNYQKLKWPLIRRGIKLVCVQYPMRSVEPLKKMLEPHNGVIFVDNEMLFKEAVEKTGYNGIFTDMFAGDFGHCTPRGNSLLAENIADVIVKEVFKFRPQRH